MIRIDIPPPTITGRTEAERLAQMERYLALLSERLRMFMSSIDKEGGETNGPTY